MRKLVLFFSSFGPVATHVKFYHARGIGVLAFLYCYSKFFLVNTFNVLLSHPVCLIIYSCNSFPLAESQILSVI